ncbi:MAG: hypothetical protein HRU80_04515 [Ignavibacteriales bacterium]|nr:MAG: hypothetical protein HRU80_04515 [Ignavibacteriales bacterium]
MDRKLKNTLALAGLVILLAALGFGYIYLFQRPEIKERTEVLNQLKAQEFDTESLNLQLAERTERARTLDSILAARKFNIPVNITTLQFYEFMNMATKLISRDARVNIEYIETMPEREFFFHRYKVDGVASYADLYQLIYAIEQSKELKKILEPEFTNYVDPNVESTPRFLVNFSFSVKVYFSDNDRFTTVGYSENMLRTSMRYDIFSPLIATSVPLNSEGLLDVQGAKLLAVVPEGIFVADSKGETYLLAEGDKVYLGYLTKINYEQNTAKFILNKGGIVENLVLVLEKEKRK